MNSAQKRLFLKIRLFLGILLVGHFLCSCSLIHCTSPSEIGELSAEEKARAGLLERDVRFLSVDCHPRSDDFPENQNKVIRYLEKELRLNAPDVSCQKFEVDERIYKNVRAVFPGRKSERVIVGAHYDSCGMTPGADDNASGVAGVLELARMLKNCQQKYTVELVLYANEEPPHYGTEDMGSYRHVQLLKQEGQAVKAMICLEMIGYFSDETDSQDYPLYGMGLMFPDQGNFITLAGNSNSIGLAKILQHNLKPLIPTLRLNLPNIPGMCMDFSDHRNFWAAGIPAVMVTDSSFFRNKNYHEEGDLPESLDYVKMEKVVQGVYRAVREMP